MSDNFKTPTGGKCLLCNRNFFNKQLESFVEEHLKVCPQYATSVAADEETLSNIVSNLKKHVEKMEKRKAQDDSQFSTQISLTGSLINSIGTRVFELGKKKRGRDFNQSTKSTQSPKKTSKLDVEEVVVVPNSTETDVDEEETASAESSLAETDDSEEENEDVESSSGSDVSHPNATKYK